jgi:hypothetical protein
VFHHRIDGETLVVVASDTKQQCCSIALTVVVWLMLMIRAKGGTNHTYEERVTHRPFK